MYEEFKLKPYEEAALLSHYGMETLQPQIWSDAPDDPNGALSRQISKSSLNGPSGAEQDNDDWQYDDTDPLGIKPSIFGNKTRSKPLEHAAGCGVFVSHKQFDPKVFLREIHKDTSYNNLLVGTQRLHTTVDQKADQLKELVKENFDRFVGAKNTVDTVYAEMKSKNFNQTEWYGTKRFSDKLQAVNDDANKVFGPIMERRARAEKLRKTLTVLDRFRFFFNLPSSLSESIKQNKFDVAVRDYKKGKYLMSSTSTSEPPSTPTSMVPPSPISVTSSSDKSSNTTGAATNLMNVPPQQQKVFDTVWSEVEKTVVELRSNLFRQLDDPWLALDVQERNIGFLLDLDATSDPAWYYIQSQFKWINGLLKGVYDDHAKKVETLNQQVAARNGGDKKILAHRSAQFKKAVSLLYSKDFEAVFAKDKEVQIWKAILKTVKTMSDLLLKTFPDFWKLSRAFVDGKYYKNTNPASTTNNDPRKRRHGVDAKKVEQCHTMAKQVIELHVALLFSILSLSPPAQGSGAQNITGGTLNALDRNVKPDQRSNKADTTMSSLQQLSPFESPNTISVLTCHFLTKIIVELAHYFNDIKAIKMSNEALTVMCGFMEKCRWRFVDIICDGWLADAKLFYAHEDWVPDSDNVELTGLLKLFHRFQKFNARSTYRIVNVIVTTGDEKEERRNMVVPPLFMDRIRNAFFDAVYHLLDGLHYLAFLEHPRAGATEGEDSVLVKGGTDIDRMDCRILITLSNLAYLKRVAVPKLVGMFESAFKTAMNSETQMLNDLINHLDGLLFDDYIKRKNRAISEIVKNGFLFSGIDWHTISKPTEVHPFIYEALLAMVLVHAEVNDLSRTLVRRALAALFENFAQDTLEAVRRVHKFGAGGMLQATLEIEFVHQVLAKYVTPTAGALLQLTYSTVEQSFDANGKEVSGASDHQGDLRNVKELLVECRRATSVQFLCFSSIIDISLELLS